MSKLLILSLFILFLLSIACKKQGCTDSLSKNYNSEANKDNGTCEYDGNCVFWFMPNNSLQLANCTYVKIYVDNVFIGGMATSSNYLSVPGCNEGGVTYYTDMGKNETKTISYKITNASNTFAEPEVYSGTLKINGGVCGNFNIQ
jgi:hypothetical protein